MIKAITLAMIAALAMPPAEFAGQPRQPVAVHYVSHDTIEDKCGHSLEVSLNRLEGKQVTILGCSILDKKPIQIYVLNDLDKDARQKVLKHEYGHVNGWPWNHPKASSQH